MRPERRSVPGLAEELPALEASLATDPSPRNVMKVAEALWVLGEASSAADLLRPLVKASPALVAPRVLLAWCLEDAGRPEEAVRHRRIVADLDPANPFGAEEGYAPSAPEVEAEPERALTPEELRKIPPGPLYSATLAEIFAKQGFQEKANEIYRRLERPGTAP